jgi:hypothetical protein
MWEGARDHEYVVPGHAERHDKQTRRLRRELHGLRSGHRASAVPRSWLMAARESAQPSPRRQRGLRAPRGPDREVADIHTIKRQQPCKRVGSAAHRNPAGARERLARLTITQLAEFGQELRRTPPPWNRQRQTFTHSNRRYAASRATRTRKS